MKIAHGFLIDATGAVAVEEIEGIYVTMEKDVVTELEMHYIEVTVKSGREYLMEHWDSREEAEEVIMALFDDPA